MPPKALVHCLLLLGKVTPAKLGDDGAHQAGVNNNRRPTYILMQLQIKRFELWIRFPVSADFSRPVLAKSLPKRRAIPSRGGITIKRLAQGVNLHLQSAVYPGGEIAEAAHVAARPSAPRP